MYLHLGNDIVVHRSEIVGIFDIENTSIKKNTKEFLKYAEQSGEVINVSFEMPKSFVVCVKDGVQKVYISQISCQTLRKRAEGNEDTRVEFFDCKNGKEISLY
ncbi:MAG: DUF370 domain-containing protein [Ruminococcus sp.]|nr:DUF370 domain-containing protein [Ruminococcus sp.]